MLLGRYFLLKYYFIGQKYQLVINGARKDIGVCGCRCSFWSHFGIIEGRNMLTSLYLPWLTLLIVVSKPKNKDVSRCLRSFQGWSYWAHPTVTVASQTKANVAEDAVNSAAILTTTSSGRMLQESVLYGLWLLVPFYVPITGLHGVAREAAIDAG
ncbi:hypothetical protein NC651_007528 [Populus alba x Populus x berolinensis]|nr:hypothetical protein NC651_007528 [Populus alba x Populus x berolinensis]